MKKEEVIKKIQGAKTLKALNEGLDAWCDLVEDLTAEEERKIARIYDEKEKELEPLKLKKKVCYLVMGKLSDLEGEVYNHILDCFEADMYDEAEELTAVWDALIEVSKGLGNYYEKL